MRSYGSSPLGILIRSPLRSRHPRRRRKCRPKRPTSLPRSSPIRTCHSSTYGNRTPTGRWLNGTRRVRKGSKRTHLRSGSGWSSESGSGLLYRHPHFVRCAHLAVYSARSVPFPTLPQITEVFGLVPEVPVPYLRQRPPPPGAPKAEPTPAPATTASWVPDWIGTLFGRRTEGKKGETPQVNTFLSLKQGDRTIIVAVVDGGNVGWTRLGRGGFEDHSMVPHGW